LKFAYFSHGKGSKYRGQYRNILLMCVALMKTEFLDKDATDEIIAKVGAVFDLNSGLIIQKRIRMPKKSGDGYLKGMKKATDDEWNSRYADVEIKGVDLDEPDDVAEFLFGKGIAAKDLRSFEQVNALVQKLPKFDQYQINKIYHKKTGHFIDDTPVS